MIIYIVLISLILISMISGGGSSSRESKNGIKWLRFIFIFIYLLCALRSSSVGRDVSGYEMVYEQTKFVNWGNWDYVYFETGYILLMKLCISFGFSFQSFLAVAYLIIIFPIYLFIKKYSNNYGLSTLLFVCYQFFNFNLSGIRQAIAMSIALLGYMFLIESKKHPLFKYILFCIIATFFHKGAFICFVFAAVYFIKNIKKFYILMIGTICILFFMRSNLMFFIKEWFDKETLDTTVGMYIGTNFLMVFILSILFSWYLNKLMNAKNQNMELDREILKTTINVKMYIIGFLTLILFGAGTAVRSYMVMNQVMLVQLPNVIESNIIKPKEILIITISVIFILFFILDVLMTGGFDIVPYKFFWQEI